MSTLPNTPDLIVLHPKTTDSPSEWPEDVARMRRILEEAGYTATDHDIQWAWFEHSETYAATWLSLYAEDSAVLSVLLGWLGPDERTDQHLAEQEEKP